MQTLTGLSVICGPLNIGGLSLIEYVPVSGVEYIDRVISGHNLQPAITLKAGYTWLQAQLKMMPSGWSHQAVDGKHGTYYRIRVTGDVPRYTPALAGELLTMQDHTYILRVTDRNGQRWIFGDTTNGALFLDSTASGNKSSNANKVRISWSISTPTPAYGFIPAW